MSYHPYHERGHSLTTKRKNYNLTDRDRSPTPWTPIIEWQKNNIKLFPSIAEFNTWWKDVLENFETGKEEVADGVFIVRYKDEDLLDYLNQQLIIETAPSFSQKVDNYEKLLASKKSEFPGNGKEN